jgi:hypothetical protein
MVTRVAADGPAWKGGREAVEEDQARKPISIA